MSKAAFQAKLRSSAISPAAAKKAGITYQTAQQTAKSLGEQWGSHRPSMLLPHIDWNGKKLPSYRHRFLEGSDKEHRYSQPKGSPLSVHFPPLPGKTKWSTYLKDPRNYVLISEGELTSYSATLLGLPTICLGGVWGWKQQGELHPHLDRIKWENRRVVIAFDADVMIKPQVQLALTGIAKQLLARGARIKTLHLPSINGDVATGLDDFIAHHGQSTAKKLLAEMISEAPDFETSRALWEFNEEAAVILGSGKILRLRKYDIEYLSDDNALTKNAAQVAFADFRHTIEVPVGDGEKTKFVEKETLDEWLKWSYRRSYERVVYAPGEPEVTAHNELNTWRPSNVEPRKGDLKLMMRYFDDFLLANVHKDRELAKHKLFQWIAYPLQQPAMKTRTALVLYSNEHGTGKSTLGYFVGGLHGMHNFAEIKQSHIDASFNRMITQNTIILADELMSGEGGRKSTTERIKHMVTNEMVIVNEKYERERQQRDYTNWIFTTNHPDALALSHHDRRFFVLEVRGPRNDVDARWLRGAFQKWRKSPEGLSAAMYFFLTYDLSDFDPYEAAFRSEARESIIEYSSSNVQTWVRDNLLRSPESTITGRMAKSKLELFTGKDLLVSYQHDNPSDGRTTMITIGKALKQCGIESHLVKLNLKNKKHKVVRMYAIVHTEKWNKRPLTEWAKHYLDRTEVNF